MVVEDARAHAGRPELLIVIPGFAAAVRCAGPALARLPALETLLARADRTDGRDEDSVVALARAYPELTGAAQIPRGPLSRLADVGTQATGWSARADPVHLATVRDGLRLVPLVDVTGAEAQALAATCNAALAEHGLALETPVPERWYLRAPRPLDFTAAEPDAIAGLDVYPFQAAGADGAYVRRVATELQMVLHEHPVNRARAERGSLAVNSIWLWGGGVLPASFAAAGVPALWSDDPVVRGLWRLAGATPHPWSEAATPAAPGVVVLRTPEQAAQRGDVARCAALIEWLESHCLRAACDGLRAGDVVRVRLVLGADGEYALDRRALSRWWRRAKAPGVLLWAGPNL